MDAFILRSMIYIRKMKTKYLIFAIIGVSILILGLTIFQNVSHPFSMEVITTKPEIYSHIIP